MWREPLLAHWRGLLLSAIGIAATISLALSGRLDWYIHPRYLAFTVAMSAIALLVVLAAAATLIGDRRGVRARETEREHGIGQRSGTERRARPLRLALRGTGSALIVAVSAGAMLVLPPATLSTATVAQRSINGSVPDGGTVLPDGGDTSDFGVREWSQLLLEQSGEQALGREAAMLGFVSPDPESEDVFYVTRFVVTHCVIDAQPVGVPIYRPGWQETLRADEWVEVSGAFSTDPTASGSHPVVLLPSQLEPVDAPEDPYVF